MDRVADASEIIESPQSNFFGKFRCQRQKALGLNVIERRTVECGECWLMQSVRSETQFR